MRVSIRFLLVVAGCCSALNQAQASSTPDSGSTPTSPVSTSTVTSTASPQSTTTVSTTTSPVSTTTTPVSTTTDSVTTTTTPVSTTTDSVSTTTTPVSTTTVSTTPVSTTTTPVSTTTDSVTTTTTPVSTTTDSVSTTKKKPIQGVCLTDKIVRVMVKCLAKRFRKIQPTDAFVSNNLRDLIHRKDVSGWFSFFADQFRIEENVTNIIFYVECYIKAIDT